MAAITVACLSLVLGEFYCITYLKRTLNISLHVSTALYDTLLGFEISIHGFRRIIDPKLKARGLFLKQHTIVYVENLNHCARACFKQFFNTLQE